MNFYLGEIIMGGWNFAPRGTAFCNGQLLPIAQFSALFSLLGTTYGGDGRTTFGLPDLRGRLPMHFGNGAGLSPRGLGEKGGQEVNVLTTNQLASHLHGLTQARLSVPVSAEDADQDEASGNFLANGTFYHNNPDDVYGSGSLAVTGNTDTVGNNAPVNNMPPFLTTNYVIVTLGIFPSRS